MKTEDPEQFGRDLTSARHAVVTATGAVIAGVTALLFLSYLVLLFILPSEVIANLVPDDAFYYFNIARNFAKGYGFSFDAINPTNGFQPLWMYLLLPVAYLTRATPVEVFPRVALLYQNLLLVLAVVTLHLALRRWCDAPVLLLSDAIAILLGLRLFVNGMETTVVLLTFALAVYYLSGRDATPPGATYFAAAGIIAVLIFLARLDSVFIILFWIAIHGAQWKRIGLRWNHLLLMVAVAAILAAPYLLYNLWTFGDWMPISGRLKNSFPHIEQVDWSRVPAQHYLVLIACLLALGWLWRRMEQQRLLLSFLLAWLVGSCVHAVHTILFMKWAVFNWHFAPYWMPLTVIMPLALGELRTTRFVRASYTLGVVLWVAILLAVGQFAGELLSTKALLRWAVASYRAAVWARQHTPSDAVFAMKDAGRFGYYSDRRVVNLDGLVNNIELQHYMRARRLHEYLQKKGVRFLVQHAVTPRSNMIENAPAVVDGTYRSTHIFYISRLYNVRSDGILLQRERERLRMRHGDGVFLIWEIR